MIIQNIPSVDLIPWFTFQKQFLKRQYWKKGALLTFGELENAYSIT